MRIDMCSLTDVIRLCDCPSQTQLQPPTSKMSLPFNSCLRLLVRLPDAEQRTARGRDRAITYGRAFPSVMEGERHAVDLTDNMVRSEAVLRGTTNALANADQSEPREVETLLTGLCWS